MAERKLEIVIEGKDRASGVLKGLGDVAKNALGYAIGSVLVPAFRALTGELTSFITEAASAQEAQALLASTIQATGGVAGVTADMANTLANSLSSLTKFEDDAILSGETLLLTFTNIGADVFPMATEAMLNMSTVVGQDLKASATQLGKALQDPINGVTALTRVGVNFTEAQKEQIAAMVEAGDVAGAQTVILRELEREFGGAAKAAGQTFAGQLAILKNNLGNLKEAIGGAVLPILERLAREANSFLTTATPALGDAFTFIIESLSSLGGYAEGWGQNLGTSFANGIAAALPYIVGVIRAISQIIAYWFAPGSPPKVAEQIDEWGQALIREYFGAFADADLSAISSFSSELTNLLSTALGAGIVTETGAAGLLSPVQDQLQAIEAELKATGSIAESSFSALRSAGGVLGPQIERAARNFFQLEGASEGAASAVSSVSEALAKAVEESKTAEESGGGSGSGASADAIAQSLVAQYATGASGTKATFGLDLTSISTQADAIAASITGTMFPVVDQIKEKWADVEDFIVTPLQAVKDWVMTQWPKVEKGLSAVGDELENVWNWFQGKDYQKSWLTSGLSAVKNWWDTSGATVFGGIIGELSSAWDWLQGKEYTPGWLTTHLDTIKGWWDANAVPVLQGLGKELESAWDWLQGKPYADTWLTRTLNNVSEWWEGSGQPALQGVASELGNIWDLLFGSTGETPMSQLLGGDTAEGGLSGAAERIRDRLATALANTDWEDAAQAIVDGIGEALLVATTVVENIVTSCTDAITSEAGQQTIAGFGAAAADALMLAIAAFFQKDDGAKTGDNVWAAIVGNLTRTAGSIGEALVVSATAFVGGLWAEIIGQVHGEEAEKQATAIWQTLATTLGTVWGNFTEFVTTAITDPVGWIKGVFSGENLLTAGVGLDLAPMWEGIKTNVSNHWETDIKPIGANIVNGITEGISNTWESLVTAIGGFFTDLWTSVKTQLGIESPSTVYTTIGEEIVNGLITGIGNKVEELKTQAVAMLQGMIDRVKEFLGIASPSTVYTTIGEQIVNGLIAGIGNRLEALKSKATSTLSEVGKAVATFLGFDSDEPVWATVGTTMMDNLMHGVGGKLQNLKEHFRSVLEQGRLALLDKDSGIITPWVETGKLFLGWVMDGVTQAIPDFISGLIAQFVGAVGAAVAGAGAQLPSGGGGGGAGGSGGGSGAKAAGGPVYAGGSYLVGERGPELFVPNRSGTIVPNDRLAGNTTVWNITVNSTQTQTGILDDLRYLQALGAGA